MDGPPPVEGGTTMTGQMGADPWESAMVKVDVRGVRSGVAVVRGGEKRMEVNEVGQSERDGEYGTRVGIGRKRSKARLAMLLTAACEFGRVAGRARSE